MKIETVVEYKDDNGAKYENKFTLNLNQFEKILVR